MILCADDYGISPGVSRGIRELIEAGRLSATGCMVGFSDLEEDMRQLRAYREQIDIGLHVVLTDHAPLSAPEREAGLRVDGGRLPSFGLLARRAYRGQLGRRALFRELAAQVERFVALMGFAPAFIDGHQHVQQLPGVRSALAEVIRGDRRLRDVYVRVGSRPLLSPATALANPSWSTFFGSHGIALPSAGARRVFRAAGIATNRYLLGYYPPEKGIAFSDVFTWYMRQRPSSDDIFFCHPGCVDPVLGTRDSMTDEREEVLAFLGSDEFDRCLEGSETAINRFGGIAGFGAG